jgi:hypothetical protein
MTGLIGAGADLITVLTDICTGIGALVMLLWTLAIIGWTIAARAERKAPMAAAPAGDWVDQLIADIGMCPWCKIRECMDPGLCTCDDPCGMPLCTALETEIVP